MLISCEKCSTTYVLDDKLIPAQGAPVQCTRCGHVFTAKAPVAGSAASAPAVSPTSTQMFGSTDPSGGVPTNRTQMFGAPGSGAGGGGATPNRTVMFGAPGSEAPASGGAQNRTIVFGAGGGDAPASPSKTAMFGAPQGEAPSPNKTVMFGIAGAPAPAGSGGALANRTMMFGAPGSEEPAEKGGGAVSPNKTMMFGVDGAPLPSGGGGGAGATPNKTIIFGVEGAAAPSGGGGGGGGASPANRTMMFGAAGEAAGVPQTSGNPRSTMMFGAPQADPGPAHGPPPRQSNTQMFGTPAAQHSAQQGAPTQKMSSTMMFGAPAAAAPAAAAQAPQKTSSTMMFGSPVAEKPAPAAAQAQKTSGTMIFGAGPVVGGAPAQKAPKLTESTVRIGPEDLERMMREHESSGGGDASTPSEPVSAVEARQNKTQMFAMKDQPEGAPPPGGNDSVARQNKTQMFAMADMERSAKGGRSATGAQGAPTPRSGVDASALDTFPPELGSRTPVTDASSTLINEEPLPTPSGGPQSKTAPNLGDDHGGARVELPPEAPDMLSGNTAPMQRVDADPAATLRAQVARRNRIAIIIIALALVAAAVGVTWKVFGRALLNRAPPAAAVDGVDQALSKLRRDDSKDKEEAVKQLTALIVTYPDFIEGHAALVTAVSLQLDDVQQRVRRIEQLVERNNTRIARYNREKSPSNWETQANTLSAQVEQLIKEHKPLSEEGHQLDTRAREAYKGLELAVTRVGDPSKAARLAALRAQALFHGVSGTEEAIKLSDRYDKNSIGQPPDGWIDLAIPEYAANQRVSEEMMATAQAKLEELHKRDATFLRTYVLAARLALIRKDLDAATTDLDQVLSMQTNHDVALELREWIKKLPRSDEKKEPGNP